MRKAINLCSHNEQQQDTTCMQGIIDTIVINDHICSGERMACPGKKKIILLATSSDR